MHAFKPHQTIMFLGENASPDHPGYIEVVRSVVDHFHPDLHLNLIGAGGRGQTIAGIRSQALMALLTSARPDWLVLALGSIEALREPASRGLLEEYAETQRSADAGLEAVFGPEFRASDIVHGEHDESHSFAPGELKNLSRFEGDLRAVLVELFGAGIHPMLMTPAIPFMDFPLLPVFKEYSRVVRATGDEMGVTVVDVERAFLDLIDRASNYKQRVVLAEPDGRLNKQGETLVARTFLRAVELLP